MHSNLPALLQEHGSIDHAAVALYIGRLAPSGRPTMLDALKVAAEALQTGRGAQETPWTRLGYAEVEVLKARLLERYAKRTVNKVLAAVKGVLETAWKLDHYSFEELARVRLVRYESVSNEPAAGRALSNEEIDRLIDAAEADRTPVALRNAALIAVLCSGGLRRFEPTMLTVEAYVDGALEVLGKGNKRRRVPLPSDTQALLERWLKIVPRPGPMFPRATMGGRFLGNSRPLTRHGVHHIVKEVGKWAGVKLSAHDLRRTYGTELLDKGADVLTVQKLMGHASPTSTMIYDRRGEKTARAAAELLNRRKGTDK